MSGLSMEEQVSLRELRSALVKNGTVVVGLVVIAVLLAVARSTFVAPQFEAEARLIVLAPNEAVTDLQTLQLYRNLVPTYREILSSRRAMDAVLRELRLDWSAEEYERRVRIEADDESQTLDVVVRASSPDDAARIATGAAEVMARVAAEVMREERLVLLDTAVPPEKPVSPRPALEIPLAGILGLITGAGVAVALEVFDHRIRDETDVERRLGLPVLGVIPHIDSVTYR